MKIGGLQPKLWPKIRTQSMMAHTNQWEITPNTVKFPLFTSEWAIKGEGLSALIPSFMSGRGYKIDPVCL